MADEKKAPQKAKKKELPRYRINCPHPGAQIPGVAGLVPPGTEVTIGFMITADRKRVEIEPRNSWIPLNDAAHEAFERRNAKILDKAKFEGINGSAPYNEIELEGLRRKLQPEPDHTPHMTSVDDEDEDAIITKEADAPPPPPGAPVGKVESPIKALVPPKAPKAPEGRASDS